MESAYRVIKGLNIANIVLSILLIFSSISLLLSCSALTVASEALGQEAAQSMSFESDVVSDDVDADIDEIFSDQGLDIIDEIIGNDIDSSDSLTALAGVGFIAGTIVGVMGIVFSILQLISAIFMLITAIISLKNYNKPAKLKAAFVMAIIAACLSLICGAIPTLVLFIISAVYIGKARNAYKAEEEANAAQDEAPVAPALGSAE